MLGHRPTATFGLSSAPGDPKGPTRDWPVGYRALMTDVWAGEKLLVRDFSVETGILISEEDFEQT